MYNRAFTPEWITELKPNEIFVFGSNLAGAHGGGAKSHSDGDLRYNAILYGMQIVQEYQQNGVPLTMDNFVQGAQHLLAKLKPTIFVRRQRYM